MHRIYDKWAKIARESYDFEHSTTINIIDNNQQFLIDETNKKNYKFKKKL